MSTDNNIDFDDLQWGSFTRQFKAYQKKDPSVKSLKQFAKLVLKKNSRFHSITKRRASFYLNVILKEK